jgi:uncharacterized protein YndB with AHSA1/START domain
MTTAKNETVYTQDVANKKMTVVREFAAPIERVWAAWTQAELLDKWWAPKPWKAETKSMNFKEGGMWLYAMVGPQGEKHWSRCDYNSISAPKHFNSLDCFCDEKGNINPDFGKSTWNNQFQSSSNGTRVTVEITYEKKEDMEKMIQMGFKEGFAMGHNNLDELLAKQ